MLFQGYGIRILPSYIASLEASTQKMDEIARGERLFPLDMEKVASHARKWTSVMVDLLLEDNMAAHMHRMYPRPSIQEAAAAAKQVTHKMLENKHQTSGEPQGKSALTGFNIFMRHVALWELAQRGKVVYVFLRLPYSVTSHKNRIAPETQWSSTTYEDTVCSHIAMSLLLLTLK